MSNLKWIPKDPDKNIGVPGKGFINAADFSQEDLDNLIERAKNRNVDVHAFLTKSGLMPAKPQLDLDLEDTRKFEKDFEALEGLNPHAEPQQPKKRGKKVSE